MLRLFPEESLHSVNFLCVTGYLLSLIAAGLLIQPLNRSVVILKGKEVVLTNDVWRIVVDFEMSPYEEVISTIKEDLLTVEGQKREFTSISEIKQIATLSKTLETRLHNFRQVLPKLDRRRGLVDLGGAVLKTLFGTATVSDIHDLREVISELQSSQRDVIHSISKQVTYIKNLDMMTGVEADAIANLSNIVKDVVIRSHDKFKEVTRDILWLNVTIHNQSELYMVIRQLELAV